MIGLLTDHNMTAQAELIWTVFTPADWAGLEVRALFKFQDIGLPQDATDRAVWQACQEHSLLLLTDNRNADGEDSLGRVITELNNSQALPVLTVGTLDRVWEFDYREDCAYRIADIVAEIEAMLGAGRLFIP